MSIKSNLRSFLSQSLHRPPVRRVLERLPATRKFYTGWRRTHPIDRLYGVDTSGFVAVDKLGIDPTLIPHLKPYAGSQPSIIRRAIASLPELSEYRFVDLGCGKGRPLLVASEFPFRDIVGVELSADLVATARANVGAVRRRFPGRAEIEVVQENAIHFRLPDGKVVLFIYHSFDADLIARVIANLEDGLTGPVEHLFVIYYNPVWGALFDASPAFQRWYAATLPYDPSEIGFGPDDADTVVIWQSKRGAHPEHYLGSDRSIRASNSNMHAELAG